MDDVDLLEGRRHGFLALVGGGHVHRPELPANAAGAEPRDVRHDRRLAHAQIEDTQISSGTLFSQRPGEIIVTVDEGHLPMQRAGSVEERVVG
jgi:hypothetical protein